MKKAEVVDYCWGIKDSKEISELWEVLRARHKELQARIASQFSIGDRVEFNRSKTGSLVVGEVTKVNVKTIKVKTGEGNWSVSPTLLRLRK